MCNVCYGGGGGFSISVWLSTNIIRAVNLPLTSTVMKCQHSSPYVWQSLYNKADWSLLAPDPAKSSMTTDIKRI